MPSQTSGQSRQSPRPSPRAAVGRWLAGRFAGWPAGWSAGRTSATPSAPSLAAPSTEPSSETRRPTLFFLAVATRSVVWLWAVMGFSPFFGLSVMSFKLRRCTFGPFLAGFLRFHDSRAAGGLSILTLASYGLLFFWLYRLPRRRFLTRHVSRYFPRARVFSSTPFAGLWSVCCIFSSAWGWGWWFCLCFCLFSTSG